MQHPLIISLLLSLPLYYFFDRNTLKLERYIQKNYPLEWRKAMKNPMRMNFRDMKMVRRVFLRDSLKFGFLSQQADPHIAKLLKTEKQLLIAAIILAAVGMIAEKFT
jgi:hypothetical protein